MRSKGTSSIYFTRTEFRGHHCKIDALRRGEEEVFFASGEDYPDVDPLWQDGRLLLQTLKRSFTLVFKHHDKNRSLDVYVEGSREVVPDLQVIFAKAVLGEEIPREEPAEDEVYAIEGVLEPGFSFEYPAESGIADVRGTKMRFRVEGEPWRRFTAEANTVRDRDALTAFVERLRSGLPKSAPLVLDQVGLQVAFHKREGDRRAPSRMISSRIHTPCV